MKLFVGFCFAGWVFNAVTMYRKTQLGAGLAAALAAAVLWWKL